MNRLILATLCLFSAAALLSFVSFLFVLTERIHMFQLGAYQHIFLYDWMRENRKKIIGKALLPLCGLLLCFIPAVAPYGAVAAAVPNLIFLLLHLPKKAKKPLVFTARVKRLYGTACVLFLLLFGFSLVLLYLHLPLFLCQAALIFPSYVVLLSDDLNRPAESLIRKKYINEAKRKIASLPRLIVIGITGSYGKTGTKYILTKLLSEKYNVLMTPASYNTTMGVVKVIREQLTAAHDIFICEMGARRPGEIKEICDIVKPKYGVITSIGPCHLETFGSIDAIIRTKFELYDALPDDGIIFLNLDNAEIAAKALTGKRAVYYGMQQHDRADYTAEIIRLDENGTEFEVIHDGKRARFASKMLGAHNILNILGCISVARTLDVDVDALKLAVHGLSSVPHRLSVIKGTDFVILDDAFNSNPAGAHAALEVLHAFDGIKIIVTPGMVELGEKQDELNYALGINAAAVCDHIFLVGERQTKSVREGALSAGFDPKALRIFERVEDAIGAAKALPDIKRKIILLENDLPDNF